VGKDSTPTTLAAAIRRADAGQVLFAPDVLIRLLAPGRHPVAETAPRLATVRPSDRELAVLRLVATGLSTAEVAAPLYISGHTVRAHLKSALRKLGARSKLEAVLIAVRAGWITLPE
jgi:DNA-binding NarL/FixJ family response regulator